MAKLTLSDLEANYRSIQSFNSNFAAIEAALENTLSRDGTSPNAMSASLDMGSNFIINVTDPVNNQDAATKAYVDDSVAAVADFSNVYLGAKAADPSADNDGNPIITGALYYNTTDDELRVFDTTSFSWQGVVMDDGSIISTITEIDSSLRTGDDTRLVTGSAGAAGNFASWNADGDAVDSAKAVPSGDVVGTSDTQTLSGKTLNGAVIRDDSTIVDNADATKAVAFQVSGVTTGNTRTLTVPDYNGTIAISHWYTPEMFGAVGDGDGEGGGTNDATALQAALDAINAAGGGTLYLLKRYRCDAQVRAYSGTRIAVANDNAGIDGHNVSVSGALIYAAGTVSDDTALTANASKGDKTLTIASGAETPFAITPGHAVGALVRIYSDEIWYDSAATQGSSGVAATPVNIYAGEYNYIRATADGSLTLLWPLQDSYTTANSAKVELVNAVENISLEGGLYLGGDTPSTNNADGLLQVVYGANIRVRGVRTARIDNAAINLIGCVGAWIDDVFVEDQRAISAYGVAYANCQDIKITGLRAIRSRHACSGASSTATGHRCINRNILIDRFVFEASAPTYSGDSEGSGGDALDMHGGCQGVKISNGIIIGASGHGIIAECPDVTIDNVHIIDSGASAVVAVNRAHTAGYLRLNGVYIHNFSINSGGWAGIDIDIGWSSLAGGYDRIEWTGGEMIRVGNSADVEEAIHIKRSAGSNVCKRARLNPNRVEVDGSTGNAVDIAYCTSLEIGGSWQTNDAAADGWSLSNITQASIAADISATGAGSDGLVCASVTKISLEGSLNFSGATAKGIDLGATTRVFLRAGADVDVSSSGADGFVVNGASVAVIDGFINADSCGDDGVFLNNIPGLEWRAKCTADATVYGLRLTSCNDAQFVAGYIRKNTDNTTVLYVSACARALFGAGFLVEHDNASVSGLGYFTGSADMRIASTFIGNAVTRAVDLDNCDRADLGGIRIFVTSGTHGVDIDAASDGVRIHGAVIIGPSSPVTDAGTNTVYKPYGKGAAVSDTAITYTTNDPSITPNNAVTIADGSTPTVNELLEFCVELKNQVETLKSRVEDRGDIAS